MTDKHLPQAPVDEFLLFQSDDDLFAEQQRRLKEAEGELDITKLLQWKVDPKDKGV